MSAAVVETAVLALEESVEVNAGAGSAEGDEAEIFDWGVGVVCVSGPPKTRQTHLEV